MARLASGLNQQHIRRTCFHYEFDMRSDETTIFFADLTHTGSVYSSNVFPLASGLVGAYLKEYCEIPIIIELFKTPQDLNNKLQRPPKIVGFSNYSWNEKISLAFAKRIKQVSPETVIVFGGPNYGLEEEEISAFWSANPPIDFYVVKEGEEAMLRLVHSLYEVRFDANELKRRQLNIPNTHFSFHNKYPAITIKIIPTVIPNFLRSLF